MMGLSAAVSLLGALTVGAAAQDAPAVLPDVNVSATRTVEQEARRFLETVSTAPLHSLSLAKWMTPICIATANLRPEAAAAITARIEDNARAVGITVLPPGCSPSVTLLATSDGRFTATDLVDAYHSRFMASDGPTQGDERALRRFAESEVPVRWWTISALMDERTLKVLVPIWGADAAVRITTGDMYFGQNQAEALLASFVILDLSKTNGVSHVALADYLSMVVLANIDPDARGDGLPTILTLWDGGEPPVGLTRWDRAYLTALYQAPVRLSGSTPQPRSLFQRTEMARIMARELASNPEP